MATVMVKEVREKRRRRPKMRGWPEGSQLGDAWQMRGGRVRADVRAGVLGSVAAGARASRGVGVLGLRLRVRGSRRGAGSLSRHVGREAAEGVPRSRSAIGIVSVD